MKTSTRRSARRLWAILTVVTLVAGLLAAPAFGEPPPHARKDLDPRMELQVPSDLVAQLQADKALKPYIVMMAEMPAIAYEGDISGYAATKPNGGAFNPNSANVRKYTRFLNDRHAAALESIGVSESAKYLDYNISFNGFSAMLTGPEAARLLAGDGVLMVWEDEIRKPTTDLSPEFLAMDDVWEGGSGLLGEDVIIGVIDTGIWPENPAFSDREGNAVVNGSRKGQSSTLAYGPAPDGWYGDCESGERFSQDDCNNKLIGARSFRTGYGKHKAIQQGEYDSPRDWDGHGTHTASTAGGNAVETALGPITGMAPRARIAAYKACWDSDLGGCATSDLVAAIDSAVADGVDVINYSIGSSAQTLWGADELSFLFAADAGVFVATSNGNGGPDPDTTGSPSSIPWVTSVGAVAHRAGGGEVTLGDASTYTGQSLAASSGTGDLPLVDAADLGNPLCYPSMAFDGDITGKAVLCWRGEIARVDKSLAVYLQGGEGMILANVPGGASSVVADVHYVPGIHVDDVAGAAIEAYIDTAGASATANIVGSLGNTGVVAGFSSRGLGASEDLIKPDITAPGVSVLAADAERTFYGYNPTGAGYKSGTSMSSPHLAGIAALMVEAHPDWSPEAIKSALMTTADPSVTYGDDAVTPATPFEVGSGLVQTASAMDPGLVYETGFYDYLSFLCASGIDPFGDGFASCDFIQTVWGLADDPSDLNQPNIAVGSLAGSQTVTRTVTDVGGGGTYNVSVDAPAGITVTVDPAVLNLDADETASFDVTFERTTAPLGEFAFGSLTWSHGPHMVTSQLAVRPVQASFPDSVSGEGIAGSTSFDIAFGYTGDYTAAPHGLVPADMEAGNVVDDPNNSYNGVDGVTTHYIDVPVGSAYARFSLFNDYTDGDDDLDLYVYGPNPDFDLTATDPSDPGYYAFVFVGLSGSGTSAEEVNVPFPETGNADFQSLGLDFNYIVDVHGWQTDGADSNYTLFSWAFGPDLGDMTVTGPVSATLGATETVHVSWSGLTPGEMYLGAVSHSDAGGIFGLTLVEINS